MSLQRGPLHQEYYEACQSPGLVLVRLKLNLTLPKIEKLLYKTYVTTTNKYQKNQLD